MSGGFAGVIEMPLRRWPSARHGRPHRRRPPPTFLILRRQHRAADLRPPKLRFHLLRHSAVNQRHAGTAAASAVAQDVVDHRRRHIAVESSRSAADCRTGGDVLIHRRQQGQQAQRRRGRDRRAGKESGGARDGARTRQGRRAQRWRRRDRRAGNESGGARNGARTRRGQGAQRRRRRDRRAGNESDGARDGATYCGINSQAHDHGRRPCAIPDEDDAIDTEEEVAPEEPGARHAEDVGGQNMQASFF